MIQQYSGHHQYDHRVISDWAYSVIGVYYCGYLQANGMLFPLYVGKATGKEGIRGRLLQHLQQSDLPGISHFGFCVCSSEKEADDFEANEIKRLQPRHNIQGK